MEKYIIQMEVNMKVNGKMINLKDMVFISVQMEKGMKVNIKMVTLMDMQHVISLAAL